MFLHPQCDGQRYGSYLCYCEICNISSTSIHTVRKMFMNNFEIEEIHQPLAALATTRSPLRLSRGRILCPLMTWLLPKKTRKSRPGRLIGKSSRVQERVQL